MGWNTHHPLSRKKTAIMTQAFGFGPPELRVMEASALSAGASHK
jgi:hypothetical protein